MNEHLLIRIAATRRASDIGGNHEGESAATGVSTYEFNTREREATLGVISYDTGFHCGVLGCSISGQRCSAGNYFYTQTLGFNLDMQNLPAFGQVSIGGLKLILSGPGASGSRPMCDGRQQEPGGWNRVLLQVQDLAV